MGLRINQNIAAMNSYRNLSVTDGQMAKSLEKLSSGFRINRAADDAAGLSISEGLRAQVGGTKVAIRNAQDGISVVQTAEGALSEVHSILQRMRDLAVQAANTGSQDSNAVQAAQTEFNNLKSEINRIGNTTSFGSTKLLDGTFGARYQVSSAAAPFANVTFAAGNDSATVTVAGLPAFNLDLNEALDHGAGAGVMDSAQRVVDEVNRGLRAGLVGAGGDGSELQMTYSTADNGDVTYTLVGSTSFTVAANGGENAFNTHFGIAAGTYNTATGTGGVFQVGANNSANDRLSVSISQVNSTQLNLSVDLTTTAGAQAGITTVSNAITSVSTTRASLGAYQNRFEHTISNLSVAVENLSASESRIRDTDMAQEMVQFTRSQILTQAGTAMLAQANTAPQQVLQLLR